MSYIDDKLMDNHKLFDNRNSKLLIIEKMSIKIKTHKIMHMFSAI